MKKLTRTEWEKLEELEDLEEEKTEEYCKGVLGKTKPIKERLNLARTLFKKH